MYREHLATENRETHRINNPRTLYDYVERQKKARREIDKSIAAHSPQKVINEEIAQLIYMHKKVPFNLRS